MIKCKLCGADCNDSVIYCPYCGSKLADQNKPKPQPKNPALDVDNRGVDLNMPFSFYKDYMSDTDLYKIGIARLDGVVLKKDQNEAIAIFVYLAKKGYTPATVKLADICLKDSTTYNEAIVLLKKAADGGSTEAIQQLRKMGIEYKPKNSFTYDEPTSPIKRRPFNPKRWDKYDDDDDDDDDDDFDDDDFDDDIRSPRFDRELDDIANKIVYIRTRMLNSKKTVESIGYNAMGGFIIASLDAINNGAYRKITGTLCERGARAYRLKPIKISKKYNLVVLKFIDEDYLDVDFFDNLETTDEYREGDTVYCVGVSRNEIRADKCSIIEIVNKRIAPSMKHAIKLKGNIDSHMISPLVINRYGEVVGIVYDVNGKKAYAAPAKYILKVIKETVED